MLDRHVLTGRTDAAESVSGGEIGVAITEDDDDDDVNSENEGLHTEGPNPQRHLYSMTLLQKNSYRC